MKKPKKQVFVTLFHPVEGFPFFVEKHSKGLEYKLSSGVSSADLD